MVLCECDRWVLLEESPYSHRATSMGFFYLMRHRHGISAEHDRIGTVSISILGLRAVSGMPDLPNGSCEASAGSPDKFEGDPGRRLPHVRALVGDAATKCSM